MPDNPKITLSLEHYAQMKSSVKAASKKYSLDEKTITELFVDSWGRWNQYTSHQELISLVIYGSLYLQENKTELSLGQIFDTIVDVLDDKSKLLHLNQLGLTGICDFDKADTALKQSIVSDIFGSFEVFKFLKELSQDQRDESKSKFLDILKFVASVPVE